MRSCEFRLQLQLQGSELEESVPGKKHLRFCVWICLLEFVFKKWAGTAAAGCLSDEIALL
jgi:hypothetical protein